MEDFDLLKVLGTGAYGKVFLARKKTGVDKGQLFAMKVLKKATIVQKRKTTEHTKTERQVLATIRQSPFLVTMHYAFQTPSKLHLVLGKIDFARENLKCFSKIMNLEIKIGTIIQILGFLRVTQPWAKHYLNHLAAFKKPFLARRFKVFSKIRNLELKICKKIKSWDFCEWHSLEPNTT